MDRDRELFSISRLNVAQECEYKYYLRYVLKQYPKATFSFFIGGRMVHKVIEDFYGALQGIEDTEEAQKRYINERLMVHLEAKFGEYTVYTLKKHLAFEQELLKGFKTKAPKQTKRWKEECQGPLDASADYLNEIAKKQAPKIHFKKPFTELYEQIAKCANNFVEMHLEDPNVLRSIEVKLPPRWVNGVRFGGQVDVIEHYEDYLRIGDYKTGKVYWSEESVETNPQLLGYAEACKEVYGKPTHVIKVIDLLHKKVVTASVLPEHIKGYYDHITKLIDNAVALHEALELGKDSYKTPIDRGESYSCKSCEYAFCPENPCEIYKGKPPKNGTDATKESI